MLNPVLILRRPTLAPRRAARGVSIVELLVGVALGLFVIGGALGVLASNLSGSRTLTKETRLNQDLRVAADLITRDLRRAGYWGNAIKGVQSGGPQNPYGAAIDSSVAGEVSYAYSDVSSVENDGVGATESFAFRLHDGAIEMQTGAGGWTEITDKKSFKVTAFNITPTETAITLTSACTGWKPGMPAPTITVRNYAVVISGESISGPKVQRSLRTQVRVRNDTVAGACA